MSLGVIAAASRKVCVNKENSSVCQLDEISLAVSGITLAWWEESNFFQSSDLFDLVGWVELFFL